MKRLARFIIRRAGWVALIGNLLGVVGGFYSIQLYKNLRTDIEELLPTTARSVIDLEEVAQRLESIDNLSILVFSQDKAGSKRFVEDLAARLETGPEDVISSVEYEIQDELRFFKNRQALYIDLEDLKRIRNYIDDRIEYEKELYNPLTIFSEEEIPEPQLDIEGIREKYAGQTSVYANFPDGYYATPDETKRIVLAYMPSNRSGIKGAKKLQAFVEEQIAELNPQSYASDIEIRFTGGVRNTIEEQSALVADLGLSAVIVVVLTLTVMIIFFRTVQGTLALLGALLIGTLSTFALAYHTIGYLNANSAFLGAIIIGNGVNFGIMLLSRYLEERREGLGHEQALMISMSHSAAATSTAALAAGLSYGSLILTSFRGFNQFGIIGFMGMVLCWIAAFTLLPAYLTLWSRWTPGTFDHAVTREARSWIGDIAAGFIAKRPGMVTAITVAASVASIFAFANFDSDTLIESDLTKLRNKQSIESGSVYYSKYSDEIFQRYLSPIVIMPRSHEEALRISDLLEEKQANGELKLVQSIQTLDEFVPDNQRQKIKVLQEIRALLPPRIYRELPAREKALAEEFLKPEAFQTMGFDDLPELLKSKFREKTGEIGRLVLVYPPLGSAKVGSDAIISLISNLREVADHVSPGAPVAGALPVSSDLLESISHDGPRATLFSLTAVIILVFIIFRHPAPIFMVMFSLILGVLWMAGAILGFGLKINFLNFIALPITFGVGVDYGVNIFHRFKQEGPDSITRVIRGTGGAVAMAALTTMIGYGSLLLAQNQAFVSFGVLSVLSMITCAFAAIFSLPAFLQIISRFKSRGGSSLDEKNSLDVRNAESADSVQTPPLERPTLPPRPPG